MMDFVKEQLKKNSQGGWAIGMCWHPHAGALWAHQTIPNLGEEH